MPSQIPVLDGDLDEEYFDWEYGCPTRSPGRVGGANAVSGSLVVVRGAPRVPNLSGAGEAYGAVLFNNEYLVWNPVMDSYCGIHTRLRLSGGTTRPEVFQHFAQENHMATGTLDWEHEF